MKKEILIALLAIGFIFAGVVSASAAAVTWRLVETAGVNQHTPGANGRIEVGGDDGTNRCNHSAAVDCIASGTSTTGAYSFAELNFQMASSCASVAGAGNTIGQSCTSNAGCGPLTGLCIPCNPNPGLTFFGQHGGGGTKSAGTFVVKACEDEAPVTAVNIGTSEVVTNVGGSCMTMASFNSSSGCAVGPYSTNYNLRLWTNSIFTNCNTNAGTMPGLSLSGQVYAHPSYGTGTVCGYDAAGRASIGSDAGLTSGQYLWIGCGSGTLPTDLQTVCIRGAPWTSKVIAKTGANLAGVCPVDPCPTGGGGGCMGATAEGVE